MPERQTIQKAKAKQRRGDAPSTAAGEFVREEIHHVRRGKHGARSTRQAIAIGLSKARRAGIRVRPGRSASPGTKAAARRELAHPRRRRATSSRRGHATSRALRREGHSAGSRRALSAQSRRASRRRGASARKASARKAARTRAAHR